MRQPLTPPHPDGKTPYSDLLGPWLLAEGLRHLNALHREQAPRPDADDLTDYLIGRARLAGLYIRHERVKWTSGTTWDHVHEHVAPQAAKAALQRWRSDFFENQSAKGRKSGEVRRRRHYAKFLPFQVGELDGLPAKEVAERLGCSLATVYRLRKSRADWLAEEAEKEKADYSDLFELIEDERVPTPAERRAQIERMRVREEAAVLDSILRMLPDLPEPTSNLRVTDVLGQAEYERILDDVLRER